MGQSLLGVEMLIQTQRLGRSIAAILADANTLHHRQSRLVNIAVLESDDPQRKAYITHEIKQLARLQQEVGIGGFAKTLISSSKGLINEHTARCEAIEHAVKQWPVKVVGDDDPGKSADFERPGRLLSTIIFQVNLERRDSHSPHPRKRLGITINRQHGMPERGQQAGMSPATTCKIKRFAGRY